MSKSSVLAQDTLKIEEDEVKKPHSYEIFGILTKTSCGAKLSYINKKTTSQGSCFIAADALSVHKGLVYNTQITIGVIKMGPEKTILEFCVIDNPVLT